MNQFLLAFESRAFDDQSAGICGQIRARLEKDGTPIGPYDLQIAAIAIRNDFILVTRNSREFERVAGLRIENWEG